MEKPNPEIFRMACKELGVEPAQALHVGDHKTNDIVGASAAGCDSLLWGEEVSSFAEVGTQSLLVI
jgi:putative hydrolase of the HAD superfamily